MARDRKLTLLKDVPLFWGCTEREFKRIAKIVDEVSFPDGTVLMTEGSPGREMMIVGKGKVRVTRKGRKVATVGRGEVIGEMAVLDQGPRTATVTSDGDVVLYVVEAKEFGSLLRDVPSVAVRILRNVAGRLRETETAAYH